MTTSCDILAILAYQSWLGQLDTGHPAREPVQVKVREQESHRSSRGDFNIYCIDIIKYNKYVYLYRTVSVHDLFKAKVIIEVNYDDGGFKLQRSVPS